MKHTQGKWEVWNCYNEVGVGIVGKTEEICQIGNCNLSNAKLIAAAPELLKACKNALKDIIHSEKVIGGSSISRSILEQAIKKAEDM